MVGRQLDAPIVFYYLVKDQREDEANMKPLIAPRKWMVFPAEGEKIRFGHTRYHVKSVLWDLDVDEEVVVSIGLQTLEEMIEEAVEEEVSTGNGH